MNQRAERLAWLETCFDILLIVALNLIINVIVLYKILLLYAVTNKHPRNLEVAHSFAAARILRDDDLINRLNEH